MDPREVAIAILGDHIHQQETNFELDFMVERNISEQLPAAAAASMAALKREEGCSTVLDFFSRLSSRRTSSSSSSATNSAVASSDRRAEQQINTAGFKLIILAQYDVLRYSYIDDGSTIFSALRWNPNSVDYIRAKGHSAAAGANLIHVIEDPTLQWGVDALLFFLSQAQYEQIVDRGLLATIPPVTALCLSSFTPWPGEIDLRKVSLVSPNFTHLFVTTTLADNPSFQLKMDTHDQSAFNQTSTSLHSLFIGNMTHYPRDLAWEAPATALASHPSLTSFNLFGLTQLSSLKIITELFCSAAFHENNPQLTSLSFVSTKMLNEFQYESQLYNHQLYLIDDSRKAVLDGLRRHGTLHQVSFDGTPPLDGDPVIAAQIKKNAEHAGRVKLFKAEGFTQVLPSTVRLYLCGLPLSGKTSVSRSLAKWSKGSLHPWSRRLKGIKLSARTCGIEVTTIKSRGGHQRISVWDMAGQLEYHSFHDSMLPDLGDLGIPSLFLFVWNPFKVNEQGQLLRDAQAGGRLVVKHPDDFRDDFKYWLQFLASKTPKSNVLKPNVVVAVTRADLGLPDMKVELHTVFDSLRVEFEEYIHLDMQEGFFQVDAMDPKKVSRLGSHLLKCTKAILEEAINDFRICDEARNLFAGLIRKGKIPPLITKDRFFCLTKEKLGIHEEMCEAVARSLNSSGDVIFLPTLELVVMDTKWFCQKIMGDILHFNVKSVGTCTQHSSNGFFTSHYLERLLEEELNINRRQGSKCTCSRTRDSPKSEESMGVVGSDLVKLLIGLQLACPRDYTQTDSDIFLPASLCGKAREGLLPEKYMKLNDPNASYVGRRLIVRDSKRTFLTPGIFPRIQVTFHNRLTTQGINVELQQDAMAFANEGSRVLVEFCTLVKGRENFVDILVCSRKTSDEALEWVHEKVIAEMMKVFADPRGIPGVDLIQSVIQPACIRGLVEASQRQAVPIQVLRGILREHIEKKGAKLLVDGTTNAIYTWQSEPLVDDDVVRLLGEVEVVKIIGAYMGSLRETAKDVLDLSVEKKSSKQKRPEFGTTQSEKQMEALFNLVEATYEMTHEVRMDVKEIKAGMKRLSHQVEDLRGAILPRLCELFTFAKEGEAGKLPRMFVVTEDDGLGRRVVCRMVPGLHKLRLELPCECRNDQAHLVDEQSGLSITTLDNGLLKRGLPYIQAFLKVAYAATKIAAHVAVGYSDLIPDFTGVLASVVVDVPEFGPSQPFSDFTENGCSSSRIDLSGGQQWLFRVLSDYNCTTSKEIYAHFGLSRIRYADSTVAWVCDKHCSEGEPCPF